MDTNELTDLEVDRVDLVGTPASGRRFALFKSQNLPAAPPAEDVPPPAAPPQPVVKATSPLDEATVAELRKSLGVDAEIAALAKSRDEAMAQVEALTKSVSEMQRQARRAEYITLARSEGFVFGSPEEHADRLLEVADKMGAEAVEKAIEREKAIAAGYKTSGLLSEIGRSAGAQASTATAELDRRAKELVAKSGGNVDYGAAVSQVLRSDKTLATQYLAEGRAK